MLGPELESFLWRKTAARGSVGFSQAINSFLAAFYNSRTVLGPLAPILSGFHQNFTNCQKKTECQKIVFLLVYNFFVESLRRALIRIVHWPTIFQEQTSAET